MAVAARNVAKVVKAAEPVFGGGLSTTWVTGKKHQLPQVNKSASYYAKKLQVFLYKEAEYCKVGLLRHDMICPEDFPLAKKAMDRMTHDQLQGFYWRLNRAILASSRKRNLPREEWTPIDAEHLYLSDVIALLQKEEYEQKLTKSAMNDFDDNWERLLMIPFRMVNYLAIRKYRNQLAEKYSASIF